VADQVAIACVQAEVRLGDVDHNLRLLTKAVRAAKADLVTFGELFLSGYSNRDRLRALAQPLDGPAVSAVCKVARSTGRHVLFGMPEASQSVRGLVHNSAVLVCPDGAVHAYRKMYLPTFGPFEEQLYFAPGRQPVVVRTDLGTLGLFICYDLFFPELMRAYTLGGADLLCCISASPMTSRAYFEHLSVARAIENATPVTFTNLCTAERTLHFYGGSRVVDAKGALAASAKVGAPETIVGTIDHGRTADTRAGRPTLRDARPEPFAAALRALEGHQPVLGPAGRG